MNIITLDLSIVNTGYCIFTKEGKFVISGSIPTKPKFETQLRLRNIYSNLRDLFYKYDPKIVLIERGFSRHNKSTQTLFKVHGVANLAFYKCKQIEYAPNHIKSVAGNDGKMKKEDLRRLLEHIFDLEFENEDESDAFAIGITYFKNNGMRMEDILDAQERDV